MMPASKNNVQFDILASRHMPLCISDEGLITYSKNKLFVFSKGKFKQLYQFPSSVIDRLKHSIRIFERVFRIEPQSGVVFKNRLYVSRRHHIWTIDITRKKEVDLFSFRKSNIHSCPLAVVSGVEGFQDGVYFGEYFSNTNRDSVGIYGKTCDSDSFKLIYKFPAGTVRHIHSIIACPGKKCVFILTGDSDEESGIWKATNNFNTLEKVLVGSQRYRSCNAYIKQNTIIYATDIPEKANSISSYDLESREHELLFELPASCTCGCKCRDSYIFSTTIESAEPTKRSKMALFAYLFSKKRAKGIKDDFARLYFSNEIITSEILKFQKDFWPAGIARFGRIIPVYDDENDELYIYPVAVKKYDGKLLRVTDFQYKREKWNK